MTFKKRVLVLTALALVTMSTAVGLEAQNRKNFSIVSDDGGHVALGLAIRKLNVAGTFMQAPAHPDDETNALFATFGYVMGLRVIDVQNNRGDGGQNEIGPELFRDIGVLRTAELLAAHRIDGAEQYFTRAIDYGYSFSPDEVIQKWGREEIIGDYVRFFRSLRPDIVVTMNIQGGGGDRAHEATTVLVREAYAASGDPTKYPEQLREGLRPWKPYKLYFAGTGDRTRRRTRGAGRRRASGRGAGRARRSRGPLAVRPAARADVPGNLRRRAQQSQVPGHEQPASAARDRGRWPRRAGRRTWRTGRPGGRRRGWSRGRRIAVHARRHGDSRRDGETGIDALRRHRHHARGPREVRRRESPGGAHERAGGDLGGGTAGEAVVRLRQRRRHRRADRGGPHRVARAARQSRVDGPQRRGALRDRLPAEEQGTGLRRRGDRGARPHVQRDRE